MSPCPLTLTSSRQTSLLSKPLLCGDCCLYHLVFTRSCLCSIPLASSAVFHISVRTRTNPTRVSRNNINDVTTILHQVPPAYCECLLIVLYWHYFTFTLGGRRVSILYIRELRPEKLRNVLKLAQRSATFSPYSTTSFFWVYKEEVSSKWWVSLFYPTASKC